MMTNRQKRISDCLTVFIDRAYYPDYTPMVNHWEAFFSVETNGRDSVSPDMLRQIAPLLEAKGDYELQIRMVFSECAEWWAKGWGWANPLNAVVSDAKTDPALSPYVDALEKIREAFSNDPISAISNYTGFTQEEKNKYFAVKAA